jgi:hypothetical protein
VSAVAAEHQASNAQDALGERTAWVRSFDERYGDGSYARLLAQFSNPRLSYAAIAGDFGVSRERVRQWHHALFPAAPRGHERRRSRSIYDRKRRLLDDGLFRAFVRAARGHLPAAAIAPVPARDGFRKRLASIDGESVLLRHASPGGTASSGRGRVYSLSGSRSGAAFIFFDLGADGFLFVPRAIVPTGGTTYTDSTASRYSDYRNSFAALTARLSAATHDLTYDERAESHVRTVAP